MKRGLLDQRGAGDLEAALQRALQGAPTLRHAGHTLLRFFSERLGVPQALLVLRQGDRLEGLHTGLSSRMTDDVLQAAREEQAGGAAVDVDRLGPILKDRRALPPAARHLRRLGFDDGGQRFTGALWLPSEVDEETVQACHTLLGRSTPAFARLAENDALRRELEQWRHRVSHLRTAFDNLPDPVLVMDEANNLLLTNPRADDLLVSEVRDSSGRRRAVETNNLYFSAFRARVFLGGEESPELFLVDPTDGSDLLFEVKVIELPSSTGPDEGYIYILRDITDLKRATVELQGEYRRAVAAEHRARQESERLNVILANAGVPILVTDDQSDIVLMNLEAETLFEASPAEAVASRTVRVVRSNDAKLSGLISDFLLQPHARREEEVVLHEPISDREFPARVTLTKLLNRRGEPVGVVCALHDLSEEREVQRLADQLRTLNRNLEARIEKATLELSRRNRELESQREELVRASRMKSEFLAMMSHELRTPINSILGFNSLLREGVFGDLAPDQRHALERVHSASSHLLSLINDILDLSKVEAGKLSLSPETIEVAPFLQNLAESIRPMARDRGLEFHLEPPNSGSVRADPTRLRQVILNLVSNAVKFTPSGRVTVRAVQESGASRIRFEVEDTGVGIAQDDIERIFEEFSQGGQFATREHGGTGLGLTISRKLVTLMDGTLDVMSAPGEGSVFWVELPADEDEAGESAQSFREGRESSPSA